MKFIELPQKELALPHVFVLKKDKIIQFSVDYRKLNAVITRDSYALQQMGEHINTVGRAKIFSTLEANSHYWQIEEHRSDLEKTALTSQDGLYQFTRMPFALHNALFTFQCVMHVVLYAIKCKMAFFYFEEIIIFRRTPEKYMKQTGMVSRLVKDASVALKLQKCASFTQGINHLDHIIRPSRLEVANRSADVIRNRKTPTTVTELQSFLGICNEFRRIFLIFAIIASPLSVRVKKAQAKELGALKEYKFQA